MVPADEQTDDLASLVAARDLPVEIDRAALMDTFVALTGLAEDGAEAAVAESAFLANLGEARVELEMRPGGWTVRLSRSLANAAVATAVMVGILWAANIDQIPVLVLPAVLPLVVDIERARLSRRDRALLLPLRTHAGAATGHAVHPDVLYNRLPGDIQNQLSPLDFQDFMETLIENGIADDAGYGDVKLRPADRTAWIRINLR